MTTSGDAAKLQRVLDKILKEIVDGAGIGGRLWAEQVSTAAKEQSPVKDGHLRASHRAYGPVNGNKEAEVGVSAGEGVSASYAVPVHNRNPWLKMTVDIWKGKALETIAKTIKSRIGGK